MTPLERFLTTDTNLVIQHDDNPVRLAIARRDDLEE